MIFTNCDRTGPHTSYITEMPSVAFLNYRFRRIMSHNSFTFFFYVVIPIGIISWDNYKLFQTIKQCKSEITSSGHRGDLGLNVSEVKITKSLLPASKL